MDFRSLPPQWLRDIGRRHAGPHTRFGKRRGGRFRHLLPIVAIAWVRPPAFCSRRLSKNGSLATYSSASLSSASGSMAVWPFREEGRRFRAGLHECRDCHGQFTVTTKTPPHSTKLPLSTWIEAIYLTLTASKGRGKAGRLCPCDSDLNLFLALRERLKGRRVPLCDNLLRAALPLCVNHA